MVENELHLDSIKKEENFNNDEDEITYDNVKCPINL